MPFRGPAESALPEGPKTAALFEKLREDIFSGRRLPGDPISEFSLVKRYGRSQTTVRQVLSALESHGLVTRGPSRVAVITNVSQRDLEERIQTRVPLEALAWKLAVPRLAPADFAELRAVAALMSQPSSRELDYEFHSLLWTRAGNKTLFRTLDQLVTPMFMIVSLGRRSGLERRSRAKAHEEAVDLLESGRTMKIDTAVEAHIRDAYTHFVAKYQDARHLAQAMRVKKGG